ncbi:MAG: aspartate aminotransferase family protein [Ilumatobacteraceae bacterium]
MSGHRPTGPGPSSTGAASHQFMRDASSAGLPADLQPDHCPFIPVFGAPQVMFVRGAGTELWDAEGRRYLDFLCGLAVTSLGHSHPAVTAALAEQAGRLLHVSNYFANPVAAGAAVRLVALLRDATGLDGQVFFCNSGAEANEAALKIARKHGGRGRHVVVSALGSFHGRTLAALAATGQPSKHEPFQPMPEGFRHVAYDDLAAMEAAIDPSVGAVLLETVQGEGGVVPASAEYLRGVRSLCDERGILLIVDEIQTGIARTGRWFGFEHAGIVPDVVTMAKALGNGVPVGAVWARRDVAAAMKPGDHGSTYSGTAIATAAVNAVLDEMHRIDAPACARERGAELRSALSSVDGVADVRGAGLLLAAELADGLDARDVYAAALDRGLVVNAVTATALRLAPPLTVTAAEIGEACGLLSAAISDVRTRAGG